MGVKASTSSPIPEPRKGASIIAHIGRLIRYMKNERLSFGYGFTVEPRAGGKMVNYMPPGGFKSFTVYRAGSAAIAIRGGYAQTQTGTLSAVADVATVAVAADLAVFARYDLGLAGTSTPGWEVVSGSIIQTGSALPTYNARYRVVPIAAVTWDGTATAISGIVQHHTGTLPCPDMVQAKTMQTFNVAVGTTLYGWQPCTGASSTLDTRDNFLIGASGTRALGATGGASNHTHSDLTFSTADVRLDHDHPMVGGTVNNAAAGSDLNAALAGDTGAAYHYASPVSVTVAQASAKDHLPPYVAAPVYEHL